MATPANTRDENGSQFFCTFDACEWLNGKHTIFGKVTGDTIFNLLSMQELEVSADDRPENPPKILSVDILLSPFDDIVPREKKKPAPVQVAQKKKKKNVTLLSFADDDQAEQDGLQIAMASSHDLADDDPHLSKNVAVSEGDRSVSKPKLKEALEERRRSPPADAPVSVAKPPPSQPTLDSEENHDEAELSRLRAQLKSLKSRAFHVEKKRLDDDKNSVLTPLEQRRQAFLKKRTTSRKQREEETLQKLESFKSTLQSQAEKPKPIPVEAVAEEDENNQEWLKHSLAFTKRPQDFDPMAVDVQNYEYILTDPLAEQAGKKRRRSPPRA